MKKQTPNNKEEKYKKTAKSGYRACKSKKLGYALVRI